MKRRGLDDLVLAVVGTALVTFVLLVGGGMLSALLSGHGLPTHHVAGAVTAFSFFTDPSLAWRVPVGPAWLYWSTTALMVVGGTVLSVLVAKYLRSEQRSWDDDPTRVAGLADRHDVRAAAGARNLLARANILRPQLTKVAARDLGFFLGMSRRVECFASVEDSIVILGPPRSGKGYNLIIPFILDAPGAVVTTSTRPDNLAATMTARVAKGPVGVFDPQGLALGVTGTLRWSPVRGCEDPQVAMMRAGALCAGAAGGVKDANFWQQQTEVVVRCLLQAAAIDERSVAEVYSWSLSPDEAKEAVEILKTSPRATPQWGSALGTVVGLESRPRSNIWSVVSGVFAPLASPRVIEQLSPGCSDQFDPASFLADEGTLYLLGTSAGAFATANFVSALIEDVVETARRLASASLGARLDPPLALILDEAANYPLPSLSSLMSEGGGSGITTVAVLQSLAQARHRWGNDQAQAIWDSATTKIILGGSSNANDLGDLTKLIGERDWPETTTTRQSRGLVGGERSISETTRQRDILGPSTIRLIRTGHALLMLRAAKPIMLKLCPWTRRADAPTLRVKRRDVEEMLRRGAMQHRSQRPDASGFAEPPRLSPTTSSGECR